MCKEDTVIQIGGIFMLLLSTLAFFFVPGLAFAQHRIEHEEVHDCYCWMQKHQWFVLATFSTFHTDSSVIGNGSY